MNIFQKLFGTKQQDTAEASIAPVTEETKAEEAPAVAPVTEETKAEEAPAVAPVTEETKAEEAPAVAPVTEEAKVEEAPADAPVTEEAKVEEAPADAPVTEEAKVEEVPADAPVAEEAKVEEAPADAPVTEETKAEEAPADAPVTEETKVEEAPADAPVTEEAKVEEAPADAPVTEETKVEEAPAVAPKQSFRQKYAAYRASSIGVAVDEITELIETILVTVFFVLLFFTFICCVAIVDGESMLPTLQTGERLIVNRLNPHYETGDILVLNSITATTFDENGNLSEHDGLDKTIVKRLIAQAGQTVDIRFTEGIVYVDGVALDEPYTSTLTTRDEGAFSYPITIPEGYVFVLGDNRSISKDSRHPDVALVPESDILGSVFVRLSPFTVFK